MGKELTHFTIPCKDFNANTGRNIKPSDLVLKNHGSVHRNDGGKTLVHYMLKNNLYEMNMQFLLQKTVPKMITEESDALIKNEIDYKINDKRNILMVENVVDLNRFASANH